MKTFKFISVAVFLLGLSALSWTYSQKSKPKWRDLTVRYRLSQTWKGETRSIGEFVRYVRANGNWKEVQTKFDKDGNVVDSATLYADHSGLFRVSEKAKTLSYRGTPLPANFVFDEAKFRQTESFAGDGEYVAGFRTLRNRFTFPNGNVEESMHAPDLNGLVLKRITPIVNGVQTLEAVDVSTAPVLDEVFGKKPDYPIDYSSFENRIKSVESIGQKEQADKLKEEVLTRRKEQ